MTNIKWLPVVAHAADIVNSYDTPVTLRQLFYRLVADQTLPNIHQAYKTLSSTTAQARREGTFPDLSDRGRAIHRYERFTDPASALEDMIGWYRLDRTLGQDVSLYLGVEKAGIVEQLKLWFGDLSIPVLALGGYTSQTYIKEVVSDVPPDRPAILIYAGDYDPSGEDIDRDFLARTGCWDKVIRVALTDEQVIEYQLPKEEGKPTDSRAAKFIARHGELVQVELDALHPEVLRGLFTDAINDYWNHDQYRAVLAQEETDRSSLEDLRGWVA